MAFDKEAFLKNLTNRPGVYRMYDETGQILYVGKAKKLKNRVSSYFRGSGLSIKTQSLVKKIDSIEITVTNSETEALLLEQNLIKEFRPPYNIVLRDDKSYPYIFLSANHQYPRLTFHRGARKEKGEYFGPYPSAGAVRESLNLLQKVFLVRQCEDSFFRNRSRPCLQYQIKRCKGPCVDLVDQQEYAEDVRHTKLFLEGKSQQIISELVASMEQLSVDLEFEKAAKVRDRIVALRRVQETQFVEGESGHVDIIAVAEQSGTVCIQVMFVRSGRVLGSKTFFPKTGVDSEAHEVLGAFVPQFYLNTGHVADIPREIILNQSFEDQQTLETVLSEKCSYRVKLSNQVRGNRAGWLNLTVTNAENNLQSHLANKQQIYERYLALQEALQLDEMPKRMECFDISHTQGEGTVASCVVFDENGPRKSDYRKFNIQDVAAGDDYAAMEQAVRRRYVRLKKGEGKIPDILLIDGGLGQLNKAQGVLEELQVTDVILLGVAKGVTRRPGLETLIQAGLGEVFIDASSPALHLIQHIRDEAHRFAITGHRQRRAVARKQSALENIPGVGPKRRRLLLTHFGGLQEVMRASEKDLAKVPGISENLAQDIYAALHNV